MVASTTACGTPEVYRHQRYETSKIESPPSQSYVIERVPPPARQARSYDIEDTYRPSISGRTERDRRIAWHIGDRYVADRHMRSTDIRIDVQDGVVTLSGDVDNGKLKRRAEDLARDVRGVKRVRNHIAVERTGMQRDVPASAIRSDR
jgi:hypothetical protein